MHIRHLAPACGAAAIAVVAASATALAAPTAPTLTTGPAFTRGTSMQLTWSESSFSPLSGDQRYRVAVSNEDGSDNRTLTVPATTRALLVGDLQDGHLYRVEVTALERACATPAPNGQTCATFAAEDTVGAPGDARTTRIDNSAPTGTVAINQGAPYTRTLDVTLALQATDPARGNHPSSGVEAMQFTDGVFTCVGAADPGCPLPFAPTATRQLADGPDGVRIVWARFRDAARPWSPNEPQEGNASAPVFDSIVLDRSAPVVGVTPTATSIVAGATVGFAVSISDQTSGVDVQNVRWAYGDGSPEQTGLITSHTYAAPGTYTGSLTVTDRAGNATTAPFTVSVTAASGEATPPATSTTTTVVTTPTGVSTTVTTTPANGGGGPVVVTPAPQITHAPAAATVSVSPAVRLSGLRRVARARVAQPLRWSVLLSARGRVDLTVERRVRGRVVVVRRVRVTGGPGRVVLPFRAPAAGRYTVRVRTLNDTIVAPLVVTRSVRTVAAAPRAATRGGALSRR